MFMLDIELDHETEIKEIVLVLFPSDSWEEEVEKEEKVLVLILYFHIISSETKLLL